MTISFLAHININPGGAIVIVALIIAVLVAPVVSALVDGRSGG